VRRKRKARLARAYAAPLCAAVRRVHVRTLLGWHAARAARAGSARGRSGAVVLAQRFGSALNLNLLPRLGARRRLRELRPSRAVTALLHRRIARHISRTGMLRRTADELTS
jgi:hypothetical protein